MLQAYRVSNGKSNFYPKAYELSNGEALNLSCLSLFEHKTPLNEGVEQ